jgi:hypothetical protein
MVKPDVNIVVRVAPDVVSIVSSASQRQQRITRATLDATARAEARPTRVRGPFQRSGVALVLLAPGQQNQNRRRSLVDSST